MPPFRKTMEISTSSQANQMNQLLPSVQSLGKRSPWQRLANRMALQVMAIALPVALFAATAQAAAYLTPGDRGNSVIALQQRLNQLGYRISVDGQYGPATEQAVRAFQTSRNLHIDGVVGEDTSTALGLPGSEANVDFSNGIDISDSFTPGAAAAGDDLGRKRYVVMIPTQDSTTLFRVRRYFGGASAVRTPLGSYIRVRNYSSRSEAESLSSYLRKEGFRDTHVRYF